MISGGRYGDAARLSSFAFGMFGGGIVVGFVVMVEEEGVVLVESGVVCRSS